MVNANISRLRCVMLISVDIGLFRVVVMTLKVKNLIYLNKTLSKTLSKFDKK